MLLTVSPFTIVHISSLHSQDTGALFFISDPSTSIQVSIIISVLSLSLSQSIDPAAFVFVQICVSHGSQPIFIIFHPIAVIDSFGRSHPTQDISYLTSSLLHPSDKVAFVDHGGTVSHDSISVRSIITKSSFKVGTIAVEYFPFTLFDSIAIYSYEPISIDVNNLSRSIHDGSIPRSLDFNLSIEEIVGPLTMPQIINPFPFIHFTSLCIGIYSKSMFELIDKGALVMISICVAVDALDQGVSIYCLSLESVSIRILYKWLPEKRRHR